MMNRMPGLAGAGLAVSLVWAVGVSAAEGASLLAAWLSVDAAEGVGAAAAGSGTGCAKVLSSTIEFVVLTGTAPTTLVPRAGDVTTANARHCVLAVDDLQIGLSGQIGKRRRQRLRRNVDLDRVGHCRHGSHQRKAQNGVDAVAQTQGGSIQWIGAHSASGGVI